MPLVVVWHCLESSGEFGWGSGVAWRATGIDPSEGYPCCQPPHGVFANPTLLHQSAVCSKTSVLTCILQSILACAFVEGYSGRFGGS